MPEIIENFFENNVFTYQSYPCSCVTDTIHISPMMPASTIYKVMSNDDSPINFAYAAKKGLVRLNKNGTIAENNVLGSFIALANQKKPDFSSFFSENGFIFPINSSAYEEISPGQLNSIVERLRNTVDLMSGVSSIHKNYKRLLGLIYLLIFSPQTEIKTSMMDKPYLTCIHKVNELVGNSSMVNERNDLAIVRFNQDNYPVSDCVYNKELTISVQEYQDCKGGYYTDQTAATLTYLYVNYQGDVAVKKCIDLLYHSIHDYGDIKNIDYSKGVTYGEGDPDFSEEMKQAIIDVAKYVIGEEINANLSGIYPQYSIHSMAPTWKVDSLLSALYFSIFYIKPDMELYRQCANPRCGKYFLVRTTSTRTKYCSTECCNRVTQDTYRKNQRVKKEN